MHPSVIFRFSKNELKAIKAAIGNVSFGDLRNVLEAHADDRDALRAIAVWMRVDDRLVVQHEDMGREFARDAFLDAVDTWAEQARATEFGHLVERYRDLVTVIERGYRLISVSLEALPFSRLSRDRQLAAALRRAALDFEDLISRGATLGSTGGVFDYMSEAVVRGDDGRPIGVDSMTAALADLVSNMIEFLAFGEWPSGPEGFELPYPPEPTVQEVEDARVALLLSMSWSRWTRWEREARYWDGDIRLVPQDEHLSELETADAVTLYQHDRGSGAHRDWIGVERLKLQQRQNLAEILSRFVLDYAGPASTRLPPEEFIDVAEVLAGSLVFVGAHLDAADPALYGGATLTEWIRGYSTLRRIGQDALEGHGGPDRHIVLLNRDDLIADLVAAGLSEDGAGSFVKGVTYRKKSIDLFDSPLLWLGNDRYLAFGPSIANVDAGRALLSNLPSLGFKLDHKGHAFEQATYDLFVSLGAGPIMPPKRKFAGEEYQIDVALPWGDYLFLFECKNLAPSNLHPKTAFDFSGEHAENVRQVIRLMDGLRQHPEILTDANGPDPNGLTVVPVVLYAMPFAIPGNDDGVYTTDFSMLARFFRSGDLAVETMFGAGSGAPLIHRQVTQRLWSGDLPSPEDLLRALDDPWAVRFVEESAVLDWTYLSLAPYQLARSPDFRIVEPTRAETADRYGIDLRIWEAELERTRRKALLVGSRREQRASILRERQFRKTTRARQNR